MPDEMEKASKVTWFLASGKKSWLHPDDRDGTISAKSFASCSCEPWVLGFENGRSTKAGSGVGVWGASSGPSPTLCPFPVDNCHLT